MGRAVLASGELGRHNGLPATLIVTATLQDLQSGAGVAATGGGSLLPMRELIRLASQSHHYLVIYDKHTRQPLYCGRAKRFATPGQRIVLHALERGCTRPGCTAPAYWCQVHHIDDWAADNGQTNITDLTLACGPDNRLVEDGGWTTRKLPTGGLPRGVRAGHQRSTESSAHFTPASTRRLRGLPCAVAASSARRGTIGVYGDLRVPMLRVGAPQHA